jgi:2-methylcitrate dehydratase PrpD
VKVHPWVLDPTGKKTPQTGADGKYSVYYGAAVALVTGAGGEKQFSDKLVRDPAIIALRNKVSSVIDTSLQEDQARIAITLKDGRRLEKFIEHVISSVQNPMSDAQLEAKFLGQADGVIPAAQTRELVGLCWNLDKLDSAARIAKVAAA